VNVTRADRQALSDLGDQLEALRAVDFELFRAELTAALAHLDGSQGERPPFDRVMMFKILVIQATNYLSDERAKFLINDRRSFMRLLELGLADRVGCPYDLVIPGEAHSGRRHQDTV